MAKVRLKGKTVYGKNKVREQGEVWLVLQLTNKVSFSAETGPWLCLESELNSKHCRWVRQHQDKNFDVIEVEE